MITQKQIAEKAGVSYATVSRALTNSAKVRPDKVRQIRKAMEELGVSSIDDLFLGKNALSKMILVIVGNIAVEFYARIVVGISKSLHESGYSIVLCNSNYQTEVEIAAVQKAVEEGYAGVIMVTVLETPEMDSFLQTVSIPVVLVNRYIRSLDCDVVRIDNYRGGYLAGKFLIDNGHTHIAHLSGPQNSAAPADRLRGFTDALNDNGISLDERDIHYGNLSRDAGKEFATYVSRGGYTAVYIGNDYMTVGAVAQFQKLGIRVPEDISIICFDDSALVNDEGLKITSLSSEPEAMGKSAADVIKKRIMEPLGQHYRIIYSPHISIRGSVMNITRTPKGKE